MLRWIIALAALALVTLTGEAAATYPGAPGGKIAFSARIGADTSNEIYTYDVDTHVLLRLTDAPGDDVEPSWNPDGSEIVFASERLDAATLNCSVDECDFDLYTVNADGSSETDLTNTPTNHEREPAWSPDGGRIAFTTFGNGEQINGVSAMDADGSNSELLFGLVSAEDQAIDATWSPDGDRLAFNDRFARIWVGNADGTGARYIGDGSDPNWSPYHDFVLVADAPSGLRALSTDGDRAAVAIPGPAGQLSPAFSPDMNRIAAVQDGQDIYLMDADGSDRQLAVGSEHSVFGLDWLANPATVPGHVRPKAAISVRVPLVPAFRQCAAPNRQHGPPLAFGSCSPPVQGSTSLTVGTPDTNGRQARAAGAITIKATGGNLATPEDEADVRLTLDISDVRRASDLADYTGSLLVPLDVRLTDRYNGCCNVGGPQPATLAVPLEVGAGCAATADPDEGARCATSTSLDAIVPATVREGLRSVWQLGQLEVRDAAGNPFMKQGVFVP